MFSAEKSAVEADILAYCAENDLPKSEEIQWSPISFEGEWGISTPFFQLAAQETRLRAARGEKGAPVPIRAQEIAAGVVDKIGALPGFERIEAQKGYLNLYFSSAEYSSRVVDTVLKAGDKFGSGAPKDQRLMVEFSQPNTHKAFHVGHLRSAILGDALSRILAYAGFDVVRANYPGDIGLHVVKWLWNYINHHSGEQPDSDTTRWMGDLYAEANQRLENNPELEAQVRELYARWDQRDPEIVKLWEETRQWSLDGFDQMYDVLDIHFDKYYFNSQMEHPGKKIVNELVERGIAIDERPEGPVFIRIDDLLGLKKEKYRVLVVLRSDNTALYSTEDLALPLQKFADYKLDKSIYVVDVRQSLHFQQVFKTLEIAGYDQAKDCIHIPYELVTLPGNVVMASREGTVVLLENLIREATERALEVVQEKNPDLKAEQKQAVANAVGLGALRYTMLARDNTKTVTFDWETALDFEGQAAPYVQYAHVRANSILRRIEGDFPGALTPSHTLEPAEIRLIDLISRLPGEVQRAAEEYKPLHLTNMAYDLARAFSDFYNQCPVLKAEPQVRAFRLRLVAAARQAIKNVLNTLGITAPEVM
ncbi:arginine--tRNA ligase [Chloroflexota bacterium]